MKLIATVISLLITLTTTASDKKIYTQEEFDKKLKQQIESKILKFKKKSIAELAQEILEREQELDKKERDLGQRQEQVNMAESSLASQIKSLELKQSKIIGCVDKNREGELRRVKQMVSVISNMRPAKAAEVLSVQESFISVKILEQIEAKKASRIFNLMDKEVSARLQKQYLNMQK